MSTRITRAAVRSTAGHVNAALGFDPDTVSYGTVGAVSLYGTSNGWMVCQVATTSGGLRELSPMGTLRETYTFLSGMLAALRIVGGAK